MVRQAAAVALALVTSSNAAFLKTNNGDKMRPDEVANTLVHVEDEWRKQAEQFTEGKATPDAFAKSCATVVSAIVQGSGGDRDVAKEYLNNVCSQKVLEGWHKTRCTTLATAITEHAMKADNYANRQSLNPAKACSGFWTEFVTQEKNREAEEAKVRAEQEKIRAEQEKKKAEAEAEEKKKAAAEAKIEAEKRAKEEAQRKKEEQEKKARQEAEEAKKRAAEAAERLAKKKAEAEKIAKEAQAKAEEAAKAEKEHQARLAEHEKAQKQLSEASKKDAEKSVKTETKPVAKEAEKPKEAAKPAAKEAPKAVEAPKPAPKETAKKVETAAAKPADKPADKPAAKTDAKKPAFLEQDPCAGCDTGLAQAYQVCAMKHGNPCAETNDAGIVTSGPGQKKDIGCCMKKEKHDRCLQCSSMDCAHKTCNVNKKYYNTYTMGKKFDDKAAMKKKGWGK